MNKILITPLFFSLIIIGSYAEDFNKKQYPSAPPSYYDRPSPSAPPSSYDQSSSDVNNNGIDTDYSGLKPIPAPPVGQESIPVAIPAPSINTHESIPVAIPVDEPVVVEGELVRDEERYEDIKNQANTDAIKVVKVILDTYGKRENFIKYFERGAESALSIIKKNPISNLNYDLGYRNGEFDGKYSAHDIIKSHAKREAFNKCDQYLSEKLGQIKSKKEFNELTKNFNVTIPSINFNLDNNRINTLNKINNQLDKINNHFNDHLNGLEWGDENFSISLLDVYSLTDLTLHVNYEINLIRVLVNVYRSYKRDYFYNEDKIYKEWLDHQFGLDMNEEFHNNLTEDEEEFYKNQFIMIYKKELNSKVHSIIDKFNKFAFNQGKIYGVLLGNEYSEIIGYKTGYKNIVESIAKNQTYENYFRQYYNEKFDEMINLALNSSSLKTDNIKVMFDAKVNSISLAFTISNRGMKDARNINIEEASSNLRFNKNIILRKVEGFSTKVYDYNNIAQFESLNALNNDLEQTIIFEIDGVKTKSTIKINFDDLLLMYINNHKDEEIAKEGILKSLLNEWNNMLYPWEINHYYYSLNEDYSKSNLGKIVKFSKIRGNEKLHNLFNDIKEIKRPWSWLYYYKNRSFNQILDKIGNQ